MFNNICLNIFACIIDFPFIFHDLVFIKQVEVEFKVFFYFIVLLGVILVDVFYNGSIRDEYLIVKIEFLIVSIFFA